MKLLTFTNGAGERLGALLDDRLVLDLTADRRVGAEFSSMLALIEGGDEALAVVAAAVAEPIDEHVVALDDVTILAPMPLPPQIRDFANYEGHVLHALQSSMTLRAAKADDPVTERERLASSGAYQIPAAWYEVPLYYKGNRFAVAGHGADVVWPAYSDVMDYELELACVIGKNGRDISRSDAEQHIFGYTIFNDFSARDAQSRWEGQFRMGPAKGKDFDGSNIFGPWIVTKDELGTLADVAELSMAVRVNGVERGRGRVGDAQHGLDRCIEHVSQGETLHAGEILALGTPATGCGFESLQFLDDGDAVELEIEGIGVLRNRVVRGERN